MRSCSTIALTRCNQTIWRRLIVGATLGAAILAVLANILGLTNVPHFTQQIIKGVVIIAAVLIEILRDRKRVNSSKGWQSVIESESKQ